MTQGPKPIAKSDVHLALSKAVELMDKKLGHDVVRPKLDSFIINGRVLRDAAKAQAFADGVKEAGHTDLHATVVKLDANHLIAGFVAPEVLAGIKQQIG